MNAVGISVPLFFCCTHTCTSIRPLTCTRANTVSTPSPHQRPYPNSNCASNVTDPSPEPHPHTPSSVTESELHPFHAAPIPLPRQHRNAPRGHTRTHEDTPQKLALRPKPDTPRGLSRQLTPDTGRPTSTGAGAVPYPVKSCISTSTAIYSNNHPHGLR